MAVEDGAVRLWQSDGAAPRPKAHLGVVRDGAIAHVILNRPEKRNAVTAHMWGEIPAVLRQLAQDSSVKLLVLRGAGREAFSGGADIDELPRVFGSVATARAYNTAVRLGQMAVERSPKPVIALIFGACVGGGCGLALSCDMRFAADTARFAITPSKLGSAYSPSDTRRLVALVGPGRAKDILFSGRPVPAAEAVQWGLVNRIAPAAELEEAAAAYANGLLENSQQSLSSIKAIINAVAGLHEQPAEDLDRLFEDSFASRDFNEGCAAFLEKRRPRFQ